MSESDRVHLRISGRVQGIGYRYSAYAEAQRLGLHGWVRNAFDGSVETEVEGAPDAVATYVAWCRRGPRMAHVTHVALAPPAGDAALPPFEIRQ